MTEAYMGIENGDTFFSEDYPRCRSVLESVGNGAAFEGLADRNGHRRKVLGEG